MTLLSLLPAFPYGDELVLAGDVAPGVARVRGATSPRKWDEQSGGGLTMGIKFTSLGLAKFEVDLEMWEPAQAIAYEQFARRRLAPPARGTRPVSMSIKHPQVNAPPLSIDQVVIEDVTQLEQDEYGLWRVTIKFIQYRPVQVTAFARPLEGPPGSPVVDKPPADQNEVTIQAQAAEISQKQARLAGGS